MTNESYGSFVTGNIVNDGMNNTVQKWTGTQF